jgi:hypothetical protein
MSMFEGQFLYPNSISCKPFWGSILPRNSNILTNIPISSSRMSLEMWKVFSFLLRDRKETTLRTMRYRKSFNKPQSPLEVYMVPLISNSYDFVTYLSITTAFKLPELIKLSEIPNLAVLEIVKLRETDQLRVGDRLVRAWSIAASTEGAFKVLRILRLWYHKEITAKSLGYINAFPVLGVYDVRGCDFTGANYPGTGRLGWTTIIGEIDIRKIMAFYATAERRDKLLRDHKISPNGVRKATAEQMWDGAKVHKIRREMVPAFLVDSKESRPVERAYRPIPPSGPIPSDEFFMTMCKEKETWEFELYSAYNRLGEIREDRDLSMAGINIGDQATVGTELVNSIPLASIRLGVNPRQMPHQHRERRYTCFIRLKLLPVSEQHEKESPAVKDPAPKRKNVSGIAEGKKMKLGDVLDSFL